MIGKSVGGAQQSQMGLCTPAQSRSPWTPPWATLGSLVEMRPRTEPPAGPGAPRLDSFAANMTDDSTIYPLEVLIVCVHIVDMGEFCERQGNTRGVRVDRIGCFQAPPRFACAQQECSSVSRGNPRTSQSFGTFHRALTGRVGRGRRLALHPQRHPQFKNKPSAFASPCLAGLPRCGFALNPATILIGWCCTLVPARGLPMELRTACSRFHSY